MVTKPVTLRRCSASAPTSPPDDAEPKDDRSKALGQALAPWTEQIKQFRVEGFYERFPAKGQVERVARIQRELARLANIERRGKLATRSSGRTWGATISLSPERRVMLVDRPHVIVTLMGALPNGSG